MNQNGIGLAEVGVVSTAVGIFLAGIAFYLTVLRLFRIRDYLSLIFFNLVAIAFSFVGEGEIGARYFSGDPGKSFRWLFARELISLLFLPAIAWFLSSFIKGPERLRRFHVGMIAVGSGFSLICGAVVALGEPGQFMAPAVAGAPRSAFVAGPYYLAAQVLLVAYLVESFLILLVDVFRWKSFGRGKIILLGSFLGVMASLSAIWHDLTGVHLDPFADSDFPRSIVALLLFGVFASLGFFSHFLRQARQVQEASRELERSRARLAELIDRDELTGLPNRRAFSRDLGELFEGRRGTRRGLAVLLFDLEGFMALNQSYGAQVADGILAAIPASLTEAVPTGCRLYRMSGDEFSVIMGECPACQGEGDAGVAARDAAARQVASAIRATLLAGIPAGGERYALDAAFAVAVLPEDGNSPAEAVANAYSALSEAKAGGNSVIRYSLDSHREALRRVSTVSDLRSGIRGGDFHLEYQPIVDWSGAIVAAETLLRWTGGREGPGYFVPLLESAGLMREMGELITAMLVEDLGKELLDGLVPSVSVNLSTLQIEDAQAFQAMRESFERSGIPPNRLQFEVTESIFLDRKAGSVERLAALRGSGSRVAIDDFGTGYSNLGYLQSLPVDKLKLDKSFLAMAPGNRSAEVLIKAVADVGRSFRLGLVAEGVETEEQFHFLKRAGYEEFQGYLFAKPLGKKDLLRFVDRGGWRKGKGRIGD